MNQIKAMLISGPEQLRSHYRDLSNPNLMHALASSRPPKTPVTAAETSAYSLRLLASRWKQLTEQIEDLARHGNAPLNDHTAELMEVFGLGRDTAAQLLVTAGDNRSDSAQRPHSHH